MSTEILTIDELVATQSAKEITVNTGLRQLEGRLVRVKSRTTTAQPGSPANGDTYILPTGPTGTNWAAFTAKQIAHYYGGSWKAWTPVEGVRVWVNDEDSVWAYNGADWVLDTRAPMLSKIVAGGANVTLTEIESRYPAIDMTGAITANIALIVTTTPKLFIIKNSATGAFTITVKTSAGTGIVVAPGSRELLYCDGTNVVVPLPVNAVSADKGDAAATLAVGSSETVSVWNTPLTADRAVTLNTYGAKNGDRLRIVRASAATGAFNLNVGTGPLKAMGTAGSFCEVDYNGTAWILTAYGAL